MIASGWKSLPTPYRGIEFRSRLEARWAMFLDLLNVKWFYEYESFDLDGLYYVPDFWLPEVQTTGIEYASDYSVVLDAEGNPKKKIDIGLWLEIKPPISPIVDEEQKCGRLANRTRTRITMQCGEPGWWLPEPFGNNGGASSTMFFPSMEEDISRFGSDDTYLPCMCLECRKVGFEYEGRSARICKHGESDRNHSYDHREIAAAAERAMFHRFDLGRQREP
jgi:hypothetical protein